MRSRCSRRSAGGSYVICDSSCTMRGALPSRTRRTDSTSDSTPSANSLSKYSEPTVSSGPISTSRCSSTGPVSMPASTQKMLRPVFVSPMRSAQCIDEMPRCRGSSDGWYWITPSGGRSSTRCGRMCVTNAITPRSGFVSANASSTSRLLELARRKSRDARGISGGPQRVGPLRRARDRRDGDDVLARRAERGEHGFAECGLADEGYAHGGSMKFVVRSG